MAEKLNPKNSYGADSDKTVSKLAKRLSVLTAVILALLPFHALFTTWAGSNFGNYDLIKIWKEILIVAMMPAIIWLALQSGQLKTWFKKSWIVRLYILYILLHIVLGLLALSWHQVNATALIYALIINLRFIGFFLLCLVLASYSDILKKYWKKILIWPATAVVTFGLVQKFILPYTFLSHFGYAPKTIPAYQTVDANIDYRRIQSTLRGANPLGAYLVLIIPAFLFIFRHRVYIWLISLATASTVLFYSYSRSAFVGLALAITSLGWILMRRPTAKWIITGVVSLLVISGLYIGFRSNQTVQGIFLHTSDTSSSVVSSNEVRNAALIDSARDVIHQPWGRGPGSAGPASFRNSHSARIAENYYLQIGEEVGILGLLIFVAVGLLTAKELWLRRTDVLAQILLASLVGITFVNLVSHAWADDTLSLLWWGLAGIALAPAILGPRHKQNGKT